MILSRRNPLPLLQRLRRWMWPHIGWRRTGRYLMMRLHRMPGSPHGIAAGVAAGAAASMTPLLGFHFVLAAGLSWLTRGNVLAAILGTVVGNPWTFPLIFAVAYQIGCLLLGEPPRAMAHLLQLSPVTLFEEVRLRFWPMLVGSLPLAVVAWFVTYLPLVRAIAAFQERRRLRREIRQRPLLRAGLDEGGT